MSSLIGQTLVCAETGKTFIGATTNNGFSTNYALSTKGEVLSDEGVDIREKQEMLNRNEPFSCYLSSDGRNVTGWKGNILGRVTQETCGGGFGNPLVHIRVIDIHSNHWHGKGAGRGMCITLRPSKTTP